MVTKEIIMANQNKKSKAPTVAAGVTFGIFAAIGNFIKRILK